MHEVSLVADLIDACQSRAAGRPIQAVRVRHASTIPEDVLRQAFQMLTEGAAMADTSLETEMITLTLACACGFDGPLGHDDILDAGTAICPNCGALSRQRRPPELELLEVRLV